MAASSTRRMSTRLHSQASCSYGAQRREWADTTTSASCAPLPSSSAQQQPPPRRRPRRHIIGVFNTLQSPFVYERLARSNVDLQVVILARWIESRVRVEMRHHLTHARSLARTNAHSHITSSSSSLLPHSQAYDRALLVVSTMQHIQMSCRRTLRRTRATLRRSHMISWCHESTNDTDGCRGRARGHSAQQVHESACSLGPWPIAMSSLAAARYSSSTVLLFLPHKTLSDEEQSQMMREEREFSKLTEQEQDVRALSCSRARWCRSYRALSNASSSKICERTHTHTHTKHTLASFAIAPRRIASCEEGTTTPWSSSTEQLPSSTSRSAKAQVNKHSRALAVRCEARTTAAAIRVVRAFVTPADHV